MNLKIVIGLFIAVLLSQSVILYEVVLFKEARYRSNVFTQEVQMDSGSKKEKTEYILVSRNDLEEMMDMRLSKYRHEVHRHEADARHVPNQEPIELTNHRLRKIEKYDEYVSYVISSGELTTEKMMGILSNFSELDRDGQSQRAESLANIFKKSSLRVSIIMD